ncbi:hypothetical protein [Bacteriovorax sp. Seq25_V]|uniref:hypothetical protein n=1 Tax=Bacteriovorax sp. Seq25_V TaxID=1201288 RepID=UPI00038A46A1|nr:hypothetical protein [Bacteriovorax sp. Seq25_V]EQC45540.1 hypothetical protein M900_2174 [Bacteriovorax sp. Seq25_V]
MNSIKKCIVILTLTLATTVNSFGAMSLFTGGSSLALTGLGVFLGGVFAGGTEVIVTGTKLPIVGSIGILAGLVLLDEQNDTFVFTELSKGQIEELSLDESTVEIYNSDISELNMIIEDVNSQMVQGMTAEDSAAIWGEYLEYVSPETREVLKKIATSKK